MSYDSTSADVFQIPSTPTINKLFLVPSHLIPSKKSDGENKTADEMKKSFEDHLVSKQEEKVKFLTDINVSVKTLRDIPFQLYVWLPKNRNEMGCGVFMFVNQHTLARTNYLAAFFTQHREVLETFKAIFESVKNQPTGAMPLPSNKI
jgi:hypothetical protein